MKKKKILSPLVDFDLTNSKIPIQKSESKRNKSSLKSSGRLNDSTSFSIKEEFRQTDTPIFEKYVTC